MVNQDVKVFNQRKVSRAVSRPVDNRCEICNHVNNNGGWRVIKERLSGNKILVCYVCGSRAYYGH